MTEELQNQTKTVVVGMSGGVDSSVAALLLVRAGYNVVGLHMKSANDIEAENDEANVRRLCESLKIKCEVVNYKSQMQIVKDYFIKEYLEGRTPNPCIICNREVKFKPFLKFMEELGADYFATGHYAQIIHNEDSHILKKAIDQDKDQTYFLCQLSQEQISKVLFPLGSLTKQEVKRIAEENHLVLKGTKESYDVCFLGSEKFKDFMTKNYPEKSGKIVDVSTNKVVGQHSGISKYTIGQRRGLNIGGVNGYDAGRWFVVKKDVKTNTLYVSCGESDKMFSTSCIVTDFNWLIESKLKIFNANVKLRYRQPDQETEVEIIDEHTVKLNFKERQRSVSIGQFAVLYGDDGTCLGGGVISNNL